MPASVSADTPDASPASPSDAANAGPLTGLQAPAQTSTVRLRGLSHTYANGVVALAPTDLDVAPGEFVTLLGPSGCGKSTLLRLVAGLETASGGTLTRDTHALGFVFQDPTLMPWATVALNVDLPLRLSGVAPAERAAAVERALATVGLAAFAQAVPRELSGGMRMRVSIARALVTQPALLLMDEPFAALDEVARLALGRELLALWARERLAVLFVTHSVAEAVFLSQRVLVMGPRPGRVLTELTIDLPQPRDESVRSLPRYTELCVAASRALQSAATT